MADERELIEERRKKAAEVRALGGNPRANGFAPTHTAAVIGAIDRLAMLLIDRPSIRDVILFPRMRPERSE
jgi:lysyl-tRNA synthetase class II